MVLTTHWSVVYGARRSLSYNPVRQDTTVETDTIYPVCEDRMIVPVLQTRPKQGGARTDVSN